MVVVDVVGHDDDDADGVDDGDDNLSEMPFCPPLELGEVSEVT